MMNNITLLMPGFSVVLKRSFASSSRVCLAAGAKVPEDHPHVPAKPNWNHNGEPFLASYKRGHGGRQSYSGVTCTVFGATGFLGRYVVNELCRMGTHVVIPFRGEAYWTRDLKVMGDLGQVTMVPFHPHDEDSIRKSVLYSNVVVNLIGTEFSTKWHTMYDTNVITAAKIARVARECGVKRLVHFSALNASKEPQLVMMNKPGCQFLITKAKGEEAVREEFPNAIIFRPSDVYGEEDHFLHYYRHACRRQFRMMPLWKKGMATIKQPVYCGDVGRGVAKAVVAPDSDGKIFEAVGPHRYYLGDLIDYMYSILRWINGIEKIPINVAFKWQLEWWSWFPTQKFAYDHVDRLEREFITDVTTGNPTLEDLGVKLARIEERWPWHLRPYRQYNYYQEAVGTFPDPALPPIVGPAN